MVDHIDDAQVFLPDIWEHHARFFIVGKDCDYAVFIPFNGCDPVSRVLAFEYVQRAGFQWHQCRLMPAIKQICHALIVGIVVAAQILSILKSASTLRCLKQ